MPNSHLGIFREWRAADRKAHALEQALSKASLDALKGECALPSHESMAHAKKLRETADALFTLAMAAMKEAADRNRR